MYRWAQVLINWLPSWIAAPFRAVVWILQVPWRVLVAVTWHIYSAYKAWWSGWWWLTHEVLDTFSETWRGFANLTGKWIPTKIRNAVNALFKILTTWVTKGWNILLKFVDSVMRWAAEQIGRLRRFITDVWDWASDRVNRLIEWVRKFGDRVVDLVLHPDKLVDWIMAYVWAQWWRLFTMWAPRVMGFIVSRGIATALRMAGFLEGVIARLI